MTQGVLDLIQAIESGDSVAIDAAFNAEMAARVSAKLDDMRTEVAKNMFAEGSCGGYKKKMKESECEDDDEEDEKKEISEEVIDDMINEVLSKNDPAGAWIKDFVDSDNPKFAGKSKEKRKQMALAAYYAKQRNEEIDVAELLDYLSEDAEALDELSKATLGSYAHKAVDDASNKSLDSSRNNNDEKMKHQSNRRIAGLKNAGKKLGVKHLDKDTKRVVDASDKSADAFERGNTQHGVGHFNAMMMAHNRAHKKITKASGVSEYDN